MYEKQTNKQTTATFIHVGFEHNAYLLNVI